MDYLLDILRPRNIDFPVVVALGEGYPITHNRIVSVEFKNIPRFPDNDLAAWCTVVCGSDGQFGTISHLTITQDPRKYAESLRDFWRKPVGLVMYGGDEDIGDSMDFFRNLQGELQELGFSIGDTDEGGTSLYRHGTLMVDKVVLRVTNYLETIKTEKELYFPR